MSFSKSLNSLDVPEKTKQYVLDVINPLLQDLVHVLLRDQPENAPQYLFHHLRRHPAVHVIEDSEEYAATSARVLSGGMEPSQADSPPSGSSEVSSSRLSDCDGAKFVMHEFKHGSRGRAAVSAEAFGEWNKKEEFAPVVFPKSDQERSHIQALIAESFLFANLEVGDFATIIDAFQLIDAPAETVVIEQGDVGDFLCVVESGSLICLKDSYIVRTCGPGDVVGELALLYNAPRAATVKATVDCKLWRLDSRTFSSIVQEGAARKRERYEEFLENVDLLRPLGPYERSQVADALVPEDCIPYHTIVREGDEGDTFYILGSGSAEAFKDDKIVQSYSQSGDYFGELALLRDEPRAATVKAGESGCRVLKLNRSAFTRLLGDLEELSQKVYE